MSTEDGSCSSERNPSNFTAFTASPMGLKSITRLPIGTYWRIRVDVAQAKIHELLVQLVDRHTHSLYGRLWAPLLLCWRMYSPISPTVPSHTPLAGSFR